MGKNIIYVLIDPRNGEFRYIGLSSKGMARPKKHTIDVQYEDTHKAHWIRKLQKLGLKYKIGILETFEHSDQLPAAEIKWISCYRGMGAGLTNLTDGGDGLLNPSEEVRAKISEAAKNISPETRDKMREAAIGNQRNLGNPHTLETRKKLSEANKGENHPMYGKTAWNKGKKLSPEHRAKISEAGKGKIISPEARRKISEAQLGSKSCNYGKKLSQKTRRKMSESQKKRWAKRKAAAQEAAA